MKVLGLNDREYKLDLKKYIVSPEDERPRSQYHLQARGLLDNTFKGYSILEEVKLPGSRDPAKKSALFLDFFIPEIKLAVEVHGRQHYEYVPFFHKTKAGFYQSKRRDTIKREWCELNEIELVVLKYAEIESWKEEIESSR